MCFSNDSFQNDQFKKPCFKCWLLLFPKQMSMQVKTKRKRSVLFVVYATLGAYDSNIIITVVCGLKKTCILLFEFLQDWSTIVVLVVYSLNLLLSLYKTLYQTIGTYRHMIHSHIVMDLFGFDLIFNGRLNHNKNMLYLLKKQR